MALQITLDPKVVTKFKELLEEEDNDDAVFRIRETKVGGGCKSHMEIKVSLDERDDPDEEEEVTVDGLPFVVSKDVIDSYGEVYTIDVDDHNMPAVHSPMHVAAADKGTCGS